MEEFLRATAFLLLASFFLLAPCRAQQPGPPHFNQLGAFEHELKPHRRNIPLQGLDQARYLGEHTLNLELTISPSGEVLHAEAHGEATDLQLWPQVEGEVYQWKFIPFLVRGKPVTAQIAEKLVLVPPERLPRRHINPPPIRPNSRISIILQRSWCDGTCDFHTVTVSTDGILFRGIHGVADGEHRARIDRQAVVALAERFAKADFYSMDHSYVGIQDSCKSSLSIVVDGHRASVEDCLGEWAGMPGVLFDLEDEVDAAAHIGRWTRGDNGLVTALLQENYDFKTYEAQQILGNAAVSGQTATVLELLAAGVPIKPLPPPKQDDPEGAPFDKVPLLADASGHPAILATFLSLGVGEEDQTNKDRALDAAASAGQLQSVRALIAYGANPTAPLPNANIPSLDPAAALETGGSWSPLLGAAQSGNPEVVRELLKYGPDLGVRDRKGRTALLVASQPMNEGQDDQRAECIRLLASAGADVNARDREGNTALHKAGLLDIAKELLDLGANVNARNLQGETPIFTNDDPQVLSLFLHHGADASVRNNEGATVSDIWTRQGLPFEKALQSVLDGFRPQ